MAKNKNRDARLVVRHHCLKESKSLCLCDKGQECQGCRYEKSGGVLKRAEEIGPGKVGTF
ncbi:MAG: hypothetical protein ACOX50_03095 [Patescibacteria group bacterium]